MCQVICCTMTAVVVCRSSVGGSPIMAARKTPPARGSSAAAGETTARITRMKTTTACMRGSFRTRERPGVARIIAERPPPRYRRPRSRPLVQSTEHPAARRRLENTEGAVVLTEGEQPAEWQTKRPAEQRAVGATVGDDGDDACGRAGQDAVEGGTGAREEIGHALAVGKRKVTDSAHPVTEGIRLTLADLVGRQSLPPPHRHLAQGRDRDWRESVRGADDLAAPSRALEVARVERVDARRGQPARLGGALCLAAGRERHVQVTDEAPSLGADHLAVAQQVDQTRAYVHADTVSSTATSVISTAAPSTSPVTPPSRAATKAPTATAITTPAATVATPRPPRANTAAATAAARPMAMADGRTPTWKAAP